MKEFVNVYTEMKFYLNHSREASGLIQKQNGLVDADMLTRLNEVKKDVESVATRLPYVTVKVVYHYLTPCNRLFQTDVVENCRRWAGTKIFTYY